MLQDVKSVPTEDASSKSEVMVSEIVTDIIDDVLNSTTSEPSVASVVFDTFKDFVSPEATTDETAQADRPSLAVTEDSLANVSTIVLPGQETEKPDLPAEVTSPKVEKKELPAEVGFEETVVSLPDSDAGIIAANGYVVCPVPAPAVSEAQKKDASSNESHESKPQHKQTSLIVPAPAAVPQTDLDTFETKMIDEVSVDDESDKRSDSGSINTVDSDMQDPDKNGEAAPVQRRQKKGQIRTRNVSRLRY